MKYLVSSCEMKEIDERTIEGMGIPAIVLMEHAAMKVAETVEAYLKEQKCANQRILVCCGTGNNGADGIAAARILYGKGYEVTISIVGDMKSASSLFLQQKEIAENFSVPIISKLDFAEYTIDENTILIDAIFGIGLSREVTGIYKDIINKINTSVKRKVFSVDVPSGLSSDNGFPQGAAVKADVTISFGYSKIGLVMYPGCEYAGKVEIADIGFAPLGKIGMSLKYHTFEREDLILLPPRKAYSNKGSYKKVLVVAGSATMSGAAFFSAKAAYMTGAGLVKVITSENNRISLQTSLPEALLYTYKEEELTRNALDLLAEEIKWADVCVIGPGIGRSEISEKILTLILENIEVPLIIDGDAIWLLGQKLNSLIDSSREKVKEEDFSPGEPVNHNILAELSVSKSADKSIQKFADNTNENKIEERIASLKGILPAKTILTPHLKELSYLLGVPVEVIQKELLHMADNCIKENNLIFTIKDARTVVASKEHQYINMSGNNGMATGGSGDVLTGIIAGLIAGGLTEFLAAALGVYLHGLAGDYACRELGEYSLMASDIIKYLPEAMSLE
ncbi:NAD(P)H-hydrate epimerase [Anaerocolumna chitinilytica]|nr:NAD(P)H-hydrate epimerase [Anaerocolumna chitinilytica]